MSAPPRLPGVMGHRGAATLAPENTIAAIRAAADAGLCWVEFDVMLTGDGVPVLFHDDSLKRTTGRDAPMDRTPWRELETLEAGSWFAPDFAGEPVPRLEDALPVLEACRLRANLEIKPTRGRDVETAVAVAATLLRHRPEGAPPPFLSSFSRISLAAVRALQPDWPLGLIAQRLPADWRDVLRALGCISMHLGQARLSAKSVRALHDAGYQVAAYTVNEPGRARKLARAGVDSLITDDPVRIREALSVLGDGALDAVR